MSTDPYTAAAEIQRTVVMHPEFERVLEGADEIIERSLRLGMPLGLIITAASGMGKTMLLKLIAQRTRQRLASLTNDDPVLELAFDSLVDPHKFADAFLQGLGYPSTPVRASFGAMTRMIDTALRRLEPKLGTIDEAQHVCEGCRDITARAVTDWLKIRMDEHCLPLALAGTHVVARLREVNPQFASRVSADFVIRTFVYGPSWHQLLGGFVGEVQTVNLEVLQDRKVARGVYDGATGNFRRLKQWLASSTHQTLRNGRGELTVADLGRGYVGAFGPNSAITNPFEGSV